MTTLDISDLATVAGGAAARTAARTVKRVARGAGNAMRTVFGKLPSQSINTKHFDPTQIDYGAYM